jgi:ABC-type multidrug transport system fused ATPase/permease subunit
VDTPIPNYSPGDGQDVLKLKKKTVRLPPQEVIDGASLQMRWLIEQDVYRQQTVNDLTDSVASTQDSLSKGFTAVKDRLDKVNGRVGKNEDEVNKIKLQKEQDRKEREQREAAIKELARVTEEKRRLDEAYRKKVFSWLQWIVGLIVVFSGSSFAEKLFNFISTSPPALIVLVVAGSVSLALLLGVYLGRRRLDVRLLDRLPSTSASDEV